MAQKLQISANMLKLAKRRFPDDYEAVIPLTDRLLFGSVPSADVQAVKFVC